MERVLEYDTTFIYLLDICVVLRLKLRVSKDNNHLVRTPLPCIIHYRPNIYIVRAFVNSRILFSRFQTILICKGTLLYFKSVYKKSCYRSRRSMDSTNEDVEKSICLRFVQGIPFGSFTELTLLKLVHLPKLNIL